MYDWNTLHSSSCGLSSVLDCTGSIDCHPFWHLAVCKCGTSPWTLRGIRRERRWSPEHRRQQIKNHSEDHSNHTTTIQHSNLPIKQSYQALSRMIKPSQVAESWEPMKSQHLIGFTRKIIQVSVVSLKPRLQEMHWWSAVRYSNNWHFAHALPRPWLPGMLTTRKVEMKHDETKPGGKLSRQKLQLAQTSLKT